jgi:hypothetical protein
MNLEKCIQSLILAVVILSSMGLQPSQGESKKVSCEEKVKYPNSNQVFPATMIKNTTGNFEPFIYWVEEIAGEAPKQRCKTVTQIIQARFDDKTWNRYYLRTGTSKGNYPIICLVGKPEDKVCGEDQIIVKLKKGEDAEKILDKMLAIRYKTDLKLTGEFRFYCDDTQQDICINIDKLLGEVEKTKTE